MLTPDQIAIILAGTTLLSAGIVIALMRRKDGTPRASDKAPPVPEVGTVPKHGPASTASRARMIAMLESPKEGER
jgi:hypothetical protein